MTAFTERAAACRASSITRATSASSRSYPASASVLRVTSLPGRAIALPRVHQADGLPQTKARAGVLVAADRRDRSSPPLPPRHLGALYRPDQHRQEGDLIVARAHRP